MSSPTETPSPLPSIVDDVAGNEERGPSPGRIHNTAPTTIAIDNEGGIPYVLRIIAQVGEGRPKEGELQSFVNFLTSTDIRISFQ